MIELQASAPASAPILAKATGHMDEQLLEQLQVRGEAAVSSLLGDKNDVWLSRPEAFNLLALATAQKAPVSPIIEAQASTYDFIHLQFHCSFRPAPECEFIRASVQVHLDADVARHSRAAIAYDMFPREVETPITVKRSFGVSPEIKLSFAMVAELSGTGVKANISNEYIAYEPEITTFALGDHAPGWDFNKTKARPIRGSKTLFLIVKKPKDAPLFGRFQLAAMLQTNIGRIPLSTFFLSGGDKPLIDESYCIFPG